MVGSLSIIRFVVMPALQVLNAVEGFYCNKQESPFFLVYYSEPAAVYIVG